MTITAELYDEINRRLVGIIDLYKDELTQYDMLVITVNLLISYVEVVVNFDKIPRDQIVDEVIELIKTRNINDFYLPTKQK